MWALPARSIPGSEMLCVEKTRIRGTNVDPSDGGAMAMGAVIGSRLLNPPSLAGAASGGPRGLASWDLLPASDEDSVVAVGAQRAEELVANLAGPGGDVGLWDGIGRPDVDDGSDRDGAHPLFRLEKRPGARRSAGVDDAGGGDRLELDEGGGHDRFLLSVNEAVGCRGDLGHEATGGHDFGSVDQ